MEVMIAFDDSHNAHIALESAMRLFREGNPNFTLISVAEEPGSATDAEDALFGTAYRELEAAANHAAGQLSALGFPTRVLMAEGDARKMILRATIERSPDVLVIARHSNKPDGGFIARRLDSLVQEFDHMTFGSVSAFLARRAQCPLLILPAP